jgi:outer membrane receptor protein involved in Fe transport
VIERRPLQRSSLALIPPSRRRTLIIAMLALAAPGAASAQGAAKSKADPAPSIDIALPGFEAEKLVVEALKSETTTQEAPAIVTILTGQQIREQGYRFLADAIGDIPGFLAHRFIYGTSVMANPRGITGGGMVLHNGLDVYDGAQGVPSLGENMPIETVKRVELVSGPGGVLWGANSLVGVINVVTKTADDLQGVEAGTGYGTGPGRPDSFRAYVMGGAKLWRDRVKVLAHVSYDMFRAPELTFPFNDSVARYSSPYPQGPVLMSGPMTSQTRLSHLITTTGNIQLGPVALYWHVPHSLRYDHAANFMGGVMRADLDEDQLDCANPSNPGCDKRVDPKQLARAATYQYNEKYAFLRYRGSFLKDRLRLDGRAAYAFFARTFERYTSIVPSSVFQGGVAINQSFPGQRASFSFDGDLALPLLKSFRVLFGGEAVYDYLPQLRANFFTDRATIDARLPYVCPPDEPGYTCPLIVAFKAERLTTGGFVDLQARVLPNLALEAGARVQASFLRSLSPVVLSSAGAVYTFLPNFNLKVNWAEGYRPPPLYKITANGEGVNWSGNPHLGVERSRAIQGELNALVLRDHKAIRQLALRTDYSYTWVTNFIDVANGTFQNLSKLGITSVEAFAELTLRKGHWFSLGYTFLDVVDADKGKWRHVPNQWLAGRVLLNLWRRQLYLASNITIVGSSQDPSKYPAQPAGPQYLGDMENGQPKSVPTYTARATDVLLERISPMPLWNAGLRFHLPKQGLRFAFDVYNLLNGTFYQQESYMDLAAYLEMVPHPREKISFFASVQYAH